MTSTSEQEDAPVKAGRQRLNVVLAFALKHIKP